MRKLITRASLGLLLAIHAPLSGQSPAPSSPPPQGPPSTDVFLAPLSTRAGNPVVGVPVNVTRRPGYDNQPSFTPDGGSLLFTSIREDAQADIYRYDIRRRTTTRLTRTPESEYSATVFGDGSRFSVVRVERDSTQRLWSFAMDGSDPRLVFESIKPVGYHAWVDSSTVALFVLGTPNTLLLANTRSGRVDTVARDVGRSLTALPLGSGFSFVQHMRDSMWVLTAVDVRRSLGAMQALPMPLARMAPAADYVAWIAPAVAISGSGSRILLWQGARARAGWTELSDLRRYGVQKISRVAVSHDGKWLAFVAEPSAAR